MGANLNRRSFITSTAAGMTLGGWLGKLATHAAETGQTKPKACILLWMAGGPSHLDTFDLKPEAPQSIGGEFRPIDTSVPGIQISEHFPQFSRLMKHAAILRSMSTAESDHQLASYHLHTGYQNQAGGISFPSVGSIVSKELGKHDVPLPNFVCIGDRPHAARSGFLGPIHQPLVVSDPDRGLDFIQPANSQEQFDRQVGLLEQFEQSLHKRSGSAAAKTHTSTLQRAVRLMNSRQKEAFDLSHEKRAVRDAYGLVAKARGTRFKGDAGGGADTSGRSIFGQGCLMASRLVEAGVPFVEVVQGRGAAWDTHRDNFPRTRTLSHECDVAMSALVTDLQQRGLLESTLVVWMGEFGRTPQTTSGGGRNHWARAWSSVLIGGGIKGGQVVGRTDRHAAEIVDRPISVTDFLGTVCTVLDIDYRKQNRSPGVERPISIVDTGKKIDVITEVVGTGSEGARSDVNPGSTQ